MITAAKPPIHRRAEPIFGVCEALGDDFGINPNWLRAAAFPLLLWQPLATVAGYAALALVVLASRLIFPDVRESIAGPAALPVANPPQPAIEQEQRELLAA